MIERHFAPMLGWLVAVGCVILVAWIWPRTKYPGSKKKPSSDALLTGLLTGIPQEKAGETPASDRGHEKSASAVALICKPSALANYLLKHCRTFNNYSPCVGWSWRASAVLQSVYDTCWSYSSPVQFVRDHLQLSDEGLVSLDWALALCGTSSHKRRRTSSTSNSPVLLIVPNSFGKITRNVLKVF